MSKNKTTTTNNETNVKNFLTVATDEQIANVIDVLITDETTTTSVPTTTTDEIAPQTNDEKIAYIDAELEIADGLLIAAKTREERMEIMDNMWKLQNERKTYEKKLELDKIARIADEQRNEIMNIPHMLISLYVAAQNDVADETAQKSYTDYLEYVQNELLAKRKLGTANITEKTNGSVGVRGEKTNEIAKLYRELLDKNIPQNELEKTLIGMGYTRSTVWHTGNKIKKGLI